MKFSERPGNAPDALKAWFYPGENSGQEFVYPKARAVELAQVTHESIPAVETEPTTVEEFKSEPIVEETPEQTEVPIAEASTPASGNRDADASSGPAEDGQRNSADRAARHAVSYLRVHAEAVR